MRHLRTVRTARKGLALAGVGLAATLALSAQASAATSLSVSPSTGLSAGQQVTVTGSGYTAGHTIVLLQCDGDKAAGTACDKSNLVAVTADSSGGVKATFTVSRSFTGVDLTGGSGTTAVDCGTGHCYLGSTDAADPGAQGSAVVLTFS